MCHNTRLLLGIVLLVLLSHNIGHARMLKGTVCSRDSVTLNFSRIECDILDGDSILLFTTTCNAKGEFILNGVSDKSSILLIHNEDFYPIYLNLTADNRKVIDFGKIYLSPRHQTLDDLVVESSHNPIDVENMTVYPNASVLKHSTSVLSVLEHFMLPGLDINRILQSSTIYGKDVIYKVDGIRRSLNYILTINPSDILKFEYSTSPSIKDYPTDAGGAINIILKKRNNGISLFENLFTSITCGMTNENLAAQMNYKKSEFNISYNAQFRNYKHSLSDSQSLFINNHDTCFRNINGKHGRLSMLLNDLSFTYNYVPNTSTYLSIKGELVFGPWKKSTYNTDTEITSDTYYEYNSIRNILQPRSIPSLDLYFKKVISGGSSIEINSVTTYNKTKDQSVLRFQIPKQSEIAYDNSISGNKVSIINDFLWDKRFNHIDSRIGLRDSYSHSSYNYAPHDSSQSRCHNLFLFADIKGRIGRVNYVVGTGLYYNDIRRRNFNRLSYIKNYSVGRWALSPMRKMSIGGTLKFSPIFPAPGNLDNVCMVTDNLTATMGNPYLKSSTKLEVDINVSFSIKGFNLFLQSYAGKTWKPVYSDIFLSDGYFTSIPMNGRSHRAFVTSFNLDYRATVSSTFSLGASGYIALNQDIFSKSPSKTKKHGSLFLKGKFFMQYKSLSFSMSFNNKSESLYGDIITITGPYSYCSLGYQWKSFNFEAMVAWIGTKYGDYKCYRNLSQINPSFTRNIIKDNENTAGIVITYRLSKGIMSRKVSRNLNNKDGGSDALILK
ncbi:MAG: hypothetical protein HDR88_12770 [Bacteroides sp.]|nr:hypothetical protein [Bacteroides sp.]